MKLLLISFCLIFACVETVHADYTMENESSKKTFLVTIVGEIKKPGRYRIPEGTTVWNLMENAGGRQTRGWGAGNIFIIRKLKDGTQVRYALDERKKKEIRSSAVLHDADIIEVPTIL